MYDDDFEFESPPDVRAELAEHRKIIAGKLVLLNDRKQRREQIEQKLNQIQSQQKTLAQCSQILQDFYTGAQKASVKRLESFVTYCLKETFGDEAYEFRIKYEIRRNQPEAEFVFVRKDEVGNEQEYDPKLACGGGCLDLATFALRLSVLISSPNRPRKILVLDEPFRYVSSNFRPNLIRLIEVLSSDERFQCQFIIVTHAEDLKELGESELGTLIEL